MPLPSSINYLEPVLNELQKPFPNNRTIHIVCHGHSVPAGYYATPYVDPFHAYPHLLHRLIKERFPFAVVNVIVTGIGGEHSLQGMHRFDHEVLNHCPSVLMIDYGLNDRLVGLEVARVAWGNMIERALAQGVKVILLTPSWDQTYYTQDEQWHSLLAHTEQIRQLASQYAVGLSDSFHQYGAYVATTGSLVDLLSHVNHPSRRGHELIAQELGRWFLAK